MSGMTRTALNECKSLKNCQNWNLTAVQQYKLLYLNLMSILHCNTYSQISCKSASTQVNEPPTFEWTFNSPRRIGKWTLYWPCGSKSKISSPKTVSRFGYSQSSDFSTTTSGVDRRLNADICCGGVAYRRLPSDCRHDWSVCETCRRQSSNSCSSSLLWKKSVLWSSDSSNWVNYPSIYFYNAGWKEWIRIDVSARLSSTSHSM